MFAVKRIDHVALTVRDVARSVAWYRQVLGFERKHEAVWGDAPAVMYGGDTAVALFQASGELSSAPDFRTAPIMRHLAFQVDRASFAAAPDVLRKHGIGFTVEDHTISRSIYFQDPDGHQLELTTYELE